VINRNTIGSPEAQLRSGPFSPAYTGDPADPFDPLGPVNSPPFGTGSLGLTVGDGSEKIAFGNEVDFFSTPFNITAVGFHIFNVAENAGEIVPTPTITLEIRPHMETVPLEVFSSLVFFPDTPLELGWSDYIDATTTGLWGITGDGFNGEPCSINSSLCSWTDMLALLDDGGDPPELLTVAITKGRDNAWHGAVDGLRINDTIYNFEEYGVLTQAA